MLKRIPALTDEAELLATLASGARRSDTRNHCVPILDMFEDFIEVAQDEIDSDLDYHRVCNDTEDDKTGKVEDSERQKFMIVVMPFLRPMNDPPFGFVNDIVILIDQLLEVSIHFLRLGLYS